MRNMFSGATAFNSDISGWNTSSVTDMGGMFEGASAFDADISGWDTSSVTDMLGMFRDASAWLASYVRVDGSSSVDGPPSAWARSSPWPPPPSLSLPLPSPSPPPSPPPSVVVDLIDYSSSANRVAPLALAASVVVVAAFAGDSPFYV
jgi:surface protein